MKVNKKIIIFAILTIFILFATPILSIAGSDPINNPGDFKPGNMSPSDVTDVTNKISPIFNTITVIGVVTGMLVIIIIGIKYMVGSVSEKAEYKKTMIPYLIGAIMIMGITGILRIFAGIVLNISNGI